jgi:hypothetical protein
MVLFPALAIMAAVLAFNLLGDALRDWLDPRTRAFLITTNLPEREEVLKVAIGKQD